VPEIRVLLSSRVEGGTISFGVRKIDSDAMAAAKRLGKAMELPNSTASLPSVILRVAETDPLLSAEAQPVLRRLFVFDNMSSNGGTEKVEVALPIVARMLLEDMADVNIRAWKRFRNDPVRYFSAALLDMYG
jgi:hypothetical protein